MINLHITSAEYSSNGYDAACKGLFLFSFVSSWYACFQSLMKLIKLLWPKFRHPRCVEYETVI